jgi:8-oxo-dGTP pyrophosphatase MutT (NUDIX family)
MNRRSHKRPGGAQVIPPDVVARDAGEPLWAGRDVDFSLSAVIARLKSSTASDFGPRPQTRASAVLALLADGPHGAEVLLTRRSSRLTNHSGEVSFPGGRLDTDEAPSAGALRETHEEVGIRPDEVRLVASLSPLNTYVSRSFIVPLVGTIERKPDLRLNADEVARAFWVPLAELIRPDTFHWEWWRFDHLELRGERPMFFFHLDDETVWGATARLLHELLCRAHGIEQVPIDEW